MSNPGRVFLSVVVAAGKLSVWWGHSVPAEWLLHDAGEKEPQRGVEDAGGAEKDLWTGEEQFYRSSHKTEPRGDLEKNILTKFGMKQNWIELISLYV